MEIKLNREFAIASTDVRDINYREMRQMYDLNNRIKDVLDSHKPDSKEKKYISDDELLLMNAILSVFTKEFSDTQTSAFDDFLEGRVKPQKTVTVDPAPFEDEKE